MPDSKNKEHTLEKVIVPRVTRLSGVVHGTVTGITFGALIFLSTIWLVIKGGEVVGPHLGLLGQFFFGYKVTVLGSFIGFGYGFLVGFILGFGIASLYKWFLKFRSG
jgi:hypothetical protein